MFAKFNRQRVRDNLSVKAVKFGTSVSIKQSLIPAN